MSPLTLPSELGTVLLSSNPWEEREMQRKLKFIKVRMGEGEWVVVERQPTEETEVTRMALQTETSSPANMGHVIRTKVQTTSGSFSNRPKKILNQIRFRTLE